MKQIIALFVFVLALTACGPADAPEQPTREELAVQSDHLAGAILSWEVQSDTERAGICAKAAAQGQLGIQQAWQAKSGGTVDEWAPATEWLLKQCEKAGYGS